MTNFNYCLRALKRLLDRCVSRLAIEIDTRRSGNMFCESSWGRFYVIYTNGDQTQPMGYYTACEYALIFGGTVFHRTGKKMKQYKAC